MSRLSFACVLRPAMFFMDTVQDSTLLIRGQVDGASATEAEDPGSIR